VGQSEAGVLAPLDPVGLECPGSSVLVVLSHLFRAAGSRDISAIYTTVAVGSGAPEVRLTHYLWWGSGAGSAIGWTHDQRRDRRRS
jgi:hypothetical protein